MTDPIVEIDECGYLFLTDISQPNYHALRLVIEEGRPAGEITSLNIAGTVIPGGTRIDITDESRSFELLWESYVAYSIRNESFVTVDAEEHYEGGLFRLYAKSHFMDFVSRATFATSEYPGSMRHHEVVCQDHIVDVVSIVSPQIRRVR